MSELSAVRRTAANARMALWKRDEHIRAARKEGHSLRVIAQAAELSHAGVKKIVERS